MTTLAPASPTINASPVSSAGQRGSIVWCLPAGPSVAQTILGGFKPMIIAVVTEKIVDEGDRAGEVDQAEHEVRTAGSLQPGDPQKLDVKAEGQRNWENWILYVLTALDVENDTVIKIAGTPYRVMTRKDFSDFGYIRYDLLQDFADA